MSKKSPLQIAFILFLSLFFWVGHIAPSYALDINQVRFGVHPDKTRMVLDLSGISDYRVFTLSNPYRLVIDLPNFTWKAGAFDPAGTTAVKDLRHGNLKPGISRIVFDLNGPVDLRTAFILPRQSEKPDRLVIDYLPTDLATFTAQKSKILGTLEINDSYQATSERTAGKQAPAPSVQKPTLSTVKPLIIIDPGHGGVDPGAIGARKTHEKNVVLAIAKELKKQLLATGKYRVMLTRENDRFIKLWDRVKFSRKNEGDLFISIHADSVQKGHVQGASIYTLSEKSSDAQTEKLAAKENRADLIAGIDLSHEDKEVTNILVDLAMRDTMNQSKFFANTLVGKLKESGVKLLDRPHRYAGFAVLKAPDVPSVLIEAGFMSNKNEERALNTSAHRKKIAEGIRKGIDAYFIQVAKNSRL